MKPSFKASATAAASLTVLACLGAPEAKAIQVVVGGNSYDVTTFTGDYSSNTAKFNITDMPWWSSSSLAQQFAVAAGAGFGSVNSSVVGQLGPLFAFEFNPAFGVNYYAFDNQNSLSVQYFSASAAADTYAILSPSLPPSSSSVPAPLALFGAAAAFGWSRQLRSRLGAGPSSGVN